jgi:hypothetical protein
MPAQGVVVHEPKSRCFEEARLAAKQFEFAMGYD